jgi:hypothetical protein
MTVNSDRPPAHRLAVAKSKRAKRANKRGAKAKNVTPAYEMTKSECAAMERVDKRLDNELPTPKFKASTDADEFQMSLDHPDPYVGGLMLADAFGTGDTDFRNGLLRQLVDVAMNGRKVDVAAANFAISVVKDIKPEDQLGAMLGAQMGAVHTVTMTLANRLNNVDDIRQFDSAVRAFNKLARTFTMQLDALKRYRSKADQTVRVERVIVNDGGQAIVGTVNQGGGGEEQK